MNRTTAVGRIAVFAATLSAALLVTANSTAAPAGPRENWTSATSPHFYKTTSLNALGRVADSAANDGSALRLTLKAGAAANPGNGIEIASRNNYGFGSYSTRMKAADCSAQPRAGVVTGAFTYATDHSDRNGNGLPDNDEIDVEWLCAQPEVIYLTLWTDYNASNDQLRKVSRVIDLRAGRIISTCFSTTFGECVAVSSAENQPTSVAAIPGYNSSTQYYEYGFDWSATGVHFYLVNASGARVTLWDYRGPASRIPTKQSIFMQNAWHTTNWDPYGFQARERPNRDLHAHVDWTQLPG
ncbi:glycoside hydrolase family 16 protein [Umezawaea beigongshangensis]|uniref:glycoside hydrolase family 16 protein n=1 Tax=Umezawaea beigongshangensis TaxID=2780383 RepID=UPI0018F186FA|nr:glycoside hydrolase family 16 protein [Umezawaea beigongshangensis]